MAKYKISPVDEDQWWRSLSPRSKAAEEKKYNDKVKFENKLIKFFTCCCSCSFLVCIGMI